MNSAFFILPSAFPAPRAWKSACHLMTPDPFQICNSANGTKRSVVPSSAANSVFCSMKTTEDVRKHAAEQGLSEQEALQNGMEEKGREFTEKGAEVYVKA